METFKLPLPHAAPHESKLLDVAGERRLRGGADTGVFKILSIGEQLAAHEPRAVGRDEDGLALATIDCEGPLEIDDREPGRAHGEGDPYNRLGRSIR